MNSTRFQISVLDINNKVIKVLRTIKHIDCTTVQSIFYSDETDNNEVYRITTDLIGVSVILGRITLTYKYGSVEIIKI